MHTGQAILALMLLAAGPASAPPRVVVCLPKGSAALEAQVGRAFAWATLTTVGPDTVAKRFPPSAESRAVGEDERRLDEVLRAAEADFLALRFNEATARLDAGAKIVDRLPPSVRHEGAFVRLELLRGRVGQARGDAGAAAAFASAAEAAVDVELDEAEYPPRVRQAYLAARAVVRARPRHAVEVTSEPADAEVEVNGQLAGRTPARLSLPRSRCFLSIARPGYQTQISACPTDDRTAIKLVPATKDGLRDQLRERIANDPAWFLEPLLLDTLAAEEDARWVVALDRDRGRGLKALVFSASEHALKPLDPSRFLETEIDKLSAAVRALVERGEKLEAQAVETPAGLPALEARASDPTLGTAVAFVRRKGSADFLKLGLSALGAGRFSAPLPPLLANDGAWDVEYYVEGRDGSGGVACQAGDAGAPLHFRRAGEGATGAHARSSRWYVWMALGIVAASATAIGIYFATRSNEVAVTFGASP